MKHPVWIAFLLCGALLLGSCKGKEPGSGTLTRGVLRVECDEAVYPVVAALAAEFKRDYPDSRISVRSVQAREAISDFAVDSVRVIIVARALNKGESDALSNSKVWFEKYHVAQSAVALVAHPDNPVKKFRMGELDSIFSGWTTLWPGWKKRAPIDLTVGDINSSTNEVFRSTVMQNRGFGISAAPIDSSGRLVEYVSRTTNALGLVGVNWLKGRSDLVSVLSVSRPGVQVDSSEVVGAAYSPAQAYVFKGYYPITTPVYIYTREVERDVSLGFISYAVSAQGQKVFLMNGLVPVTMPVRLVQLTSEQVK
jgi:phosphate transport system substrate-binding protein